MLSRTKIVSLAAVALLSVSTGCDKSEPAPGQGEQIERNDEGTVWRSLMGSLQTAPDDAAKVALLEKFVAENGEHPDLSDAKRRLDKLKNDPDAAAKKLIAELVQQGIEEGQPKAFATLLATESVRQMSSRLESGDLEEPLTIPTFDGPKEVATGLMIHPLVLRGHVRRAMKTHAADLIKDRCNRQCVNEAVSSVLSKSLGGSLFVEEGKMNPDVVGPLIEKIWVKPDEELLGIPAKDWYAVFSPTLLAYIQVDSVMKSTDLAAAIEKMKTLKPREFPAFYRAWTKENKIGQKLTWGESNVIGITGWWLRRHADGTAALFQEKIGDVVVGYDPTFELVGIDPE